MLEPEDRKEITDSFRYELSEKIDPLIQAVDEIGKRTIDHVDRLAAHRERIKDVERDVQTVGKGLASAVKTHKADFTRILIIIITSLVAILGAVIGLGFLS